MNRPSDLSDEHLEHLRSFIKTRGRFWRAKLRDYWRSGVTSGFMCADQAAALQSLRNNHAALINRITGKQLSEWMEEIRYREAAHTLHVKDGTLEIDSNAEISRGDGGAYVQAWIWVPQDQLETA